VKKYFIFLILTITLYAQESAVEAFKNKNYDKAFKLYEIDAKRGDTKAQNALSYLYFNGLGVSKDKNKGLFWLEKAANLNDAIAQYDLGMMYLSGYIVDKDSIAAFNWLTSASQQNHIEAEYNLALMYYNGDGVDINATASVELLDRAAKKGHIKATKNIGRIYMKLLKFEDALYWLEINAQAGDKEAYYLLAEIYTEQEEFAKAKIWAKKSILNGNVAASELWKKYNLEKY